jgi:hypothetical protein
MYFGNQPKQMTAAEWAAIIGFVGLVVSFGSLQDHFGGFWWIGIAVLFLGTIIAIACYVISTYEFHKTGGTVEAGVCSTCAKPVAALVGEGKWGSCPHCGHRLVNVVALTFAPSKYFVWLKWFLLGMCVFLSPAAILFGLALLTAVSGLMGGPYGVRERIPQDILFGGLGTLAYCSLVIATGLFGQAAFNGGVRRLRILAAIGALLVFVLLVSVVAFLWSNVGPNPS